MRQNAQQALLDLERNSLPPVELLDEAASILGITLDALNLDADERPSGVSFAPKEEWLFRWLLRRANLSTSGAKASKISQEDSLA